MLTDRLNKDGNTTVTSQKANGLETLGREFPKGAQCRLQSSGVWEDLKGLQL